MPTVPTLDSQQVRTRPLEIPTGDASAQPGYGIVTGLEVAGKALEMVQRERDAADEVRAQRAEVELLTERDRIMSDLDGTRGEATVKFQETVGGRWQQRASELEANLSTPRQRELFRQRALAHGSSLERAVDGRVQDAVRQLDRDTTEVLLGDAQRAMTEAAMAGDDQAVTAGIDRTAEILRAFAKRPHNGVPAEVVEAQVAAAQSKARAAHIIGLATSRRMDRAKLALTEWGDQLLPEERAAVEKVLTEGDELGRLQAAEDLTYYEFSDSLSGALASIRDQFSDEPAFREELIKRVRARFGMAEEEQKQAREVNYTTAREVVRANPGRMVRDVVPLDVWVAMTDEQQRTLEGLAEAPTQNANGLWLKFFNMSVESPEAIAKMSDSEFEGYWSRFDQAHRSDAERLRAAAKKDPSGRSGDQRFMVPMREAVENAAILADIIPAGSSVGQLRGEDRKRYIEFQDEVYRQVRDFTATGKVLEPEHLESIVNHAAIRRTFSIDEPGRDRHGVPRFALSQDDRGRTYVPIAGEGAMSLADRQRIITELNGRGITVDLMDKRQKSIRLIEQIRAAEMLGDDQRKRLLIQKAGGR